MINKDHRIEVFGCPIDNLSMSETIELIDTMIQSRKPHQHVVVNADKLLKLREDENLKQIISSCDIINADGMPIVWASRLIGKKLKERVTGIDLMENLIRYAADKGYRPYFLGAREEVVNKVIEIYRSRYPGLKIAGYRNGYWKPEEEDSVAAAIQNSKADILFVAMGSPKKEIFLRKYLSGMQVPFVMGVGGSFDVVAGHTKRAPLWMQNCGLEWFFRFLQEPRRMWKRYLIGNTRFLLLVMKESFKLFVRKRAALSK